MTDIIRKNNQRQTTISEYMLDLFQGMRGLSPTCVPGESVLGAGNRQGRPWIELCEGTRERHF